MKRREFIKYAVMVPVAVTLSPHDWGLDDVKLDQTDYGLLLAEICIF